MNWEDKWKALVTEQVNEEDHEKLSIYFNLYVKAINEIDDYFEYRNESEQDKDFVMNVLAELREELSKYKNA